MSDTSANCGIYDDFPGFRLPTDDELDSALHTALVVVDTNVLLNLYRYNEATRNDLLAVLRSLGDRLWIPHQVLREFWRNRLQVLVSRGASTEQALSALNKPPRATQDALSQWAKATALPASELAALWEKVDTFYAELKETIESYAPQAPIRIGGGADDPILRELENLLRGRVGPAPDDAAWRTAVQEGKARVARQEPPGYRDVDKMDSTFPEGPAGDYLVWQQTLHEATRRSLDVLLVTGDEKDDWWWTARSELLGPRVELTTELWRTCGRQLFMLRPPDVLKRAAALDITVRSESVEDAERVSREAAEDTESPLLLDDDHPLWDEYSGGYRVDPEWADTDQELAQVFYERVAGKAKIVLDLLIDQPGRMLSANELVELSGGAFTGRNSVAGALSSLHAAHKLSGRRYPFYWWAGDPTSYAMKPSVAALFAQARSGQITGTGEG